MEQQSGKQGNSTPALLYRSKLHPICRLRLFCYLSEDAVKKGKAIPLQAWTGPEGSRRLKLPDFKNIGTCRW